MTFNDIFKKSFLNGFSGDISTLDIVVALLVTSGLALYIFFVYRLVTRKTFYSKNFNISLAALSVITSGIILAVQSSIVISLGMVGALSIVRFRTAIKDPMDLMFLFWSISIGIVCGAGLAEIAVYVSLILTVGILVLDRVPLSRPPMLIVVNASDPAAEDGLMETVRKYSRHCRVKSRTITAGALDLVIEARLSGEADCVRALAQIESVASAALLSHDGEVTF